MCVKWTKCQALDGKFTGVCGGETGFEVCCSIQPQQPSVSTIAPTTEGLSSPQPNRPSTLDDTAVTTSLGNTTKYFTTLLLRLKQKSTNFLYVMVPIFVAEQQPSVYNLPSILLSNSGGEEDGQAGSTGQSTVVVNLPEIVQVRFQPLDTAKPIALSKHVSFYY